jgi:glycosyltransferase involved in cell wall biosynthesis
MTLRICIDARLGDGSAGGCQQFLIGLASGLSKLDRGEEEYVFLTLDGSGDWLTPYLTGPCVAAPVSIPTVPPQRAWRSAMREMAPQRVRSLVQRGRELKAFLKPVRIPDVDPEIERLEPAVVHFAHQEASRTARANIYHPHDLQHLHLPEYFTPAVRKRREALYRFFCAQATIIAVASSWTKNDLIKQYHLASEKIAVVPLAPVLEFYPKPTSSDLEQVRHRLSLPEAFAFYPAQTWPHKNHLGFLRALRLIRDGSNKTIPVVFSGLKNTFSAQIEDESRRLGLDDVVKLVGFVSPIELRALYELSRCVIIPSKFEAASFPLWEAFTAEVATGVSNVTSLPKQAGDGALIFDPDDPCQIASVLLRLWDNPSLRSDLIARGRQMVGLFRWENTARLFRAHYRRLAGRSLNDSDRDLLAATPIL